MSFSKRFRNLNPFDLHKVLINEYFLTSKGNTSLLKRDTSKDKRDIDVIRENHQFLWDEDEDNASLSWERKLAKHYYDKLFKEYCVADLSRYKENKIGLRWKTEQELVSGKGQFSCGSKRCNEQSNLRTWEVNFGYIEHGQKKNALVKLRLCQDCSKKLNYHHKRKEVKRLKNNPKKLKQCLDLSSTDAENSNNNLDSTSSDKVNNDGPLNSASHSTETSFWKQTEENIEEKSREQEFDEYLSQLFM